MKRLILASTLVLIGILLGLRPLDWIEQRYHVDPDADSGALELIVSASLIGAGAALVGSLLLARSPLTAGRDHPAASRRGPRVAKSGE